MFYISIIFTCAIVVASFYLWYKTSDTGYFGILGALAVPALVLPFACKVFRLGQNQKFVKNTLTITEKNLGL